MQTAETNKYIKLIPFEKLNFWSVAFLLDRKDHYSNNFRRIRIGEFLTRSREIVKIKNDEFYSRVTVRMNSNGVILRDKEKGENIGTKNQFKARIGQFIVSKIDARNGAFGIIPDELDGAIVTNDFPLFNINTDKINPLFFFLLTTTNAFIQFANSCSSGTTNRQRMDVEQFLNFEIPLPSLEEQELIAKNFYGNIKKAEQLEKQAENLEKEIEQYLFEQIGLKHIKTKNRTTNLNIIEYKNIFEWGTDKIMSDSKFDSEIYDLVSLSNYNLGIQEVFRGKSPKYAIKSNKYILNQKCNRWNKIEIEFAKPVIEEWHNSIAEKFFTKPGDIIINSTGEGTIGRSTYITSDFKDLVYDSHILLLRLNSEVFNPELFVELFNSSFGQTQVEEIKSAQATKQTELGISNLLKIKIPVIDDIYKQRSIVANIKHLRAKLLLDILDAALLRSDANKKFEQTIFN